ncbi:DUF6891 domain-containing protein [Kitasatospora sp. NPDC058162]|uniref:DUF6891 domain-containing protein n=1 Tax=Kitasatospora sp. NPDC058162 TaxID=3346362 RepID=UPI0036D8FCBF
MAAHDYDPLPDLERVLTDAGVSAPDAQRLVQALADAENTEAVADLLLARPSGRPGLIAPESGYVHRTEFGIELTPEPGPANFRPEDRSWRLVPGGAAFCERGEHEGWLFDRQHGRELSVPPGTRVEAGSPFTDGPPDLAGILVSMGFSRAVEAAAVRLAGLCSLEREDAERVVRPLFEPVRIVETGDLPGLAMDALCTHRRFTIARGHAIRQALRSLPVDADPRLHALVGIEDPEELVRRYGEQNLFDVFREAGLDIPFPTGRRVYLGVDAIGALPDHDGPLDPPVEPELSRLSGPECEDLLAQVRSAIVRGYATRARLVEFARDQLAFEYRRPAALQQAEALVDRMWRERLREQETWQGETDPERLTTAFSALEAEGIVAREDFTCCTSCGGAEISAEASPDSLGFVYFHRQSTDRAAAGEGLTLYYGGFDDSERTTANVGQRVVAALEQVGLPVEWNGSPGRAIEVTRVDWRRRLVG